MSRQLFAFADADLDASNDIHCKIPYCSACSQDMAHGMGFLGYSDRSRCTRLAVLSTKMS
jgi:hypothetical protein